ncbi:MAG: cytochrome c oxidase assembly protein [Gemmataceae bacterium]
MKPTSPHLRFILAAVVLLVCNSHLLAHVTAPHGSAPSAPRNWHELWRTWGTEPGVVIPLFLSAILYIRGVRRLWRERAGQGVRKWEVACFAGGWLALFIALVSPLHPWGSALFSAHMTQHEILMLVTAPLLVLSRPLVAFLKALPARWSLALSSWTKAQWWQTTWGYLVHPLVAWVIHVTILWAWHLPSLYQATLHDEFIHALQHLSFLFSALLFWWALIQGRTAALRYGVAVLYVFTSALQSGLLGALITFAHTVWYPAYEETAPAWGLTPLEDQQLGGLIMWVPACAMYIVAGLALFAGWMRTSEDRAWTWDASLSPARSHSP